MKKKCFFIALTCMIICMAPVFVACGDDGDDQPTSEGYKVETGEVRELTTTSAIVRGYLENGNAQLASNMGIIYSADFSDAASLAANGNRVPASAFETEACSRFSVELTNLQPATTYYYCAYAGEKTSAKVFSFTTEKMVATLCPDDKHPHKIDLGLPSGTLWACCNVGAREKREDYGYYFAWGETSIKQYYYQSNYKYYQGGQYQDIGSDIAGTKYDAARANWGEPWHMPTHEQCQELIKNTQHEWQTLNGINGQMLTGNNGKRIFLPAAGSCYSLKEDLYNSRNHWCFYSSSTLYESANNIYYGIDITKEWVMDSSYGRENGCPIRPVQDK